MKFARIAVLAVALVAGVVAAMLALNLRRPQVVVAPATAQQPSINTVDVLVALKDIPIGATVAPDQVGWRIWPQSGAMASYITRTAKPDAVAETAGTIAKGNFFAGEPITQAKLVSTDAGFLSAILPAGMRAVATNITADTSAGGFILPNDRVDVIMTRRDSEDRFVTETVLNNVRVLAIDQMVQEEDGQKVVVGQTATLELSPQQAQILTVAQQMSDRLTLSLRSLADARTRDFTADAVHLLSEAGQPGEGPRAVTMVRNGRAQEVNPVR